MNQTTAIYEHMKNIGPITPLEALEQYRCMRLGARIKDLKDTGVQIKSQWVTHENQLGERKRFKEYWLA